MILLAGYAERVYALLTWQHPAKTLFFAFGVSCGTLAVLVIPNKLLVAALITKMFLKGFVVSFRETDHSVTKKVPGGVCVSSAGGDERENESTAASPFLGGRRRAG